MMTHVGHDERLARAALTRIAEPGDVALAALVETHGAQAVLQGLREGRSFGRQQAGAWRVRLAGYDPATDMAAAERVGARLVCPGDGEWPDRLGDLGRVVAREGGGVPLGLWVRGTGRLAALCDRSVAIVGSRAATAYGLEAATDIAYSVAGQGVTVVSGAAYGIDGAAHRGALAAGAPTVAVLACGVDVSYPRGHTSLLDRVAEDGLVVSEVPPGSAPNRVRFLIRNRLIAALSLGTMVVEAAVRSGALNTARWAEQLLRPVLGVPGPVTSAMSAGVHQAIREGLAILVTDGPEVLEAVSAIGDNTLSRRQGETRPRDRLDELTLRVLEAVPAAHPVGAERISRAAGLPLHEVQVRLAGLLLQDFVERCGERWRLSDTARRAALPTGEEGRMVER